MQDFLQCTDSIRPESFTTLLYRRKCSGQCRSLLCPRLAQKAILNFREDRAAQPMSCKEAQAQHVDLRVSVSPISPGRMPGRVPSPSAELLEPLVSQSRRKHGKATDALLPSEAPLTASGRCWQAEFESERSNPFVALIAHVANDACLCIKTGLQGSAPLGFRYFALVIQVRLSA